VAFGVIAGVIAVFIFLVQIPGALVVRLLDEQKNAVIGARVVCRHPGSSKEMSGPTDAFGEAKFPGLEKGTWSCSVEPPARYFSPVFTTSLEVRPRLPAISELRVQRQADAAVTVVRPEGGARARAAVRVVCPAEDSKPALGWEARIGLLDGATTIYMPADRQCRIGLLRGAPGNVYATPDRLELDCANLSCSGVLVAKAGEHLSVTLKPDAAQWQAARPPPEPDDK
jgi:hypothetical protein